MPAKRVRAANEIPRDSSGAEEGTRWMTGSSAPLRNL